MTAEFEVVSEELRAASAKITRAVSPVACFTLSSSGASAGSYGHVELAEVVATFCEKASQVVSTTARGDEQAAQSLTASAGRYDGTDSASGALFGQFPFLSVPGSAAR